MSLVFTPTGFERQVLYAHGDIQQAIRRKGWSAQNFQIIYHFSTALSSSKNLPSVRTERLPWLLNVAPWIRTHALDVTELESTTSSATLWLYDIGWVSGFLQVLAS